MIIEFNTIDGKNLILAPYKVDGIINGEIKYQLRDELGKIWMEVKFENSTFIVVDKNDTISDDDDLIQLKLNKVALEVIEQEQSGTGYTESIIVEEISPYDPEKIKIHSKAFNLRLISDMIDDGDIDLAPDFQRNFVWNSLQKSSLIESILLRIPLPMFYFSEDEEGRITVVDGLQRLTTIKDFMENKFPLKGLEYLKNCEGKFYSNVDKNGNSNSKIAIDSKYQRWFNQTQFSVNVIDPSSPPKVKYDIFRRINTGGKPLNNQEIRNCLAGKGLRELLQKMVELQEFKTATDYSIKPTRMDDQEVALRFVLFRNLIGEDNNISNYTGYMDSELDDLTEDLVKSRFEDLEFLLEEFSWAMVNAEYLFGRRFAFRKIIVKDTLPTSYKQLINKALFVACSVLLSKFNPIELRSKNEANKLLLPLATLIETDRTLLNYLSYGTNGKANLNYVFKAIDNLITDQLNL